MKLNSRRLAAMVVLAIAAVAVAAPVALGNAGSGITSQVLGHRARLAESVQLNVDRIKFQTKDPTDFQMQTITFAPGGNSGWHHHPGIIWVIVESGQVTIYDGSCQAVKTVTAGNVFVESADEPTMFVRNEGTTNAVVYNAQVAPAGSAFRVEDDPPSCTLPPLPG